MARTLAPNDLARILAPDVEQEQPLLERLRGRSVVRAKAPGIVLAAALLAVVAAVALVRSSRSLRSSDRSFLEEKVLVAGGAEADIEANADKLSQAADAANAKLQADRAQVKQLREQADAKMTNGTSEVKDADAQIAAAKKAAGDAMAMEQKAEEEQAKAMAMLQEAKLNQQKAEELKTLGNTNLNDGKNLQGQADAIQGREEAEAVGAKDAVKKEVTALQSEAQYLADKARAQKEAADAALKSASAKLEAAHNKTKEAGEALQKALDEAGKAAKREQEAHNASSQAAAALAAAKQTERDSLAGLKKGEGDLKSGSEAARDAKAAQKKVDVESAKVATLEHQSAAKTAAHRVCMDIDGVHLRAPGDADGFDPIAMSKDVDSKEDCVAWCREHEACAQAVFSKWDKSCNMYPKATSEVHEWNEGYTSTVCGDKSQKHELKAMVDATATQKPVIPDPVGCSWDGEDCASTKCCNEVSCSWDFKTCPGHSCYKNGESATCMETAGWNTGVIIGGARQTREVQPAGPGTTTQATSLFCFMVVNWKNAEQAVANYAKDKKLGIFECDAQTILTGWDVPKTPWATWINADAFVKLWQQVQQSGLHLQHDWTVKVDADTVFFPNMLRMHLDALKVPQGSRTYVKNIDYKFQFNGALEVYTREAVQWYFEKGGVCAEKLIKKHEKAGEDFFMKQCMDSIGVDNLEDFMLLRDHSCGADCGAPDDSCADGWVAAYHAHRDVDSWSKCHDAARAAQLAGGHKPTDGLANAAAQAEGKELPAVAGKDAEAAKELLQQATDLHSRIAPDAQAAEAAAKDAAHRIAAAKDLIRDSKAGIAGARKNASDARDAQAGAQKAIDKASAEQRAQKAVAKAQSATKAEGEREATAAEGRVGDATAAEGSAGEVLQRAVVAETKARQDIASLRMCMDLPGVRLKGGKELNATPIAMQPNTSTPEDCREWCRQHNSCKQSVFSSGNKGCYLASDSPAEAQEFTAGFNSTFCGMYEEKDAMQAMVDKVYKSMPYVPPIRECAWAGENCIDSKCCANVPVPNWKFTEFKWYSCWKKDDFFASCETGAAPGGWNGELLGHMGTREVPPAAEGVLVQGTSLFCFCVVKWDRPATAAFWSSEAELANNIKNTGRSIMKCDDHAFFSGQGLNGGGDGSSINNIDSFINAWKQVKDDGRYLQHDWTVKVDSDAVFFPDRLRMHIQSLRTPQGSRVYLRNINFKFEFLGALEVFTKEALIRYFDKSWVCESKVGHQGGEDYWMLACMDGIGVDHQTDHQLLNDKYAATGNCNDPWVVGFHFYKKVDHWNDCYSAAINSAKINGKDYWQWE